jgi:tRNA (adenine22-N1)-methyltransferase
LISVTKARLGKRLSAVLDLCPLDGPVADVGSGHGRLALELAARSPEHGVFATELPGGPAAELRRMLGTASGVTILEGWGLRPLLGLECRGAVIAGLGGHTLTTILESDWHMASQLSWLCLQPMQRVERLVDWIWARDHWSVRRTVTVERGHVYHALLLRRP